MAEQLRVAKRRLKKSNNKKNERQLSGVRLRREKIEKKAAKTSGNRRGSEREAREESETKKKT